jgi:hypothetical protein
MGSIAIESKQIDSAKRRLRQRTNTHRSTYPKPNHPDLNQSVPNYDENDFWIDIEHQLKPAKLEIEV